MTESIGSKQLSFLLLKLILRRISHYSSAETSSAVYIIGGFHTANVVAQYRDDQWHRLNDLNEARSGLHSIVIGNELLMIGGKTGSTADAR